MRKSICSTIDCMHIVLLNDDFPLEGGDSVSHLTKVLAERLETFNHRVTIVCTHRTEDSTDVMTGEGDSLVSIPVSYRPSLRSYLSLYNPKVTKMLAQVFARLQPDVVHAHNIHKYLTYDSLRLAKKHTDRVFLTCHDAMSIAFGRVEAPKKLSIGDHIRQVGLQYNPLRNTTIRKKIRRNVKHVTAVSHALGGLLEMNGIPNVHPIHNGVNIDYWKADPQAVETFRTANSLHDKKVLLFSGRLRFEKGIPQLLQALDVVRKSVPNVLLLIV